MPYEAWSRALKPKVDGTWNLHHSLRRHGRDQALDFFLMTSSIAGTLGSLTESAYAAGNSFLDGFARYRRAQSLPATALALGLVAGVGYLAENPDIDAALRRQHLRPIDDQEVLHLVDVALSTSITANADYWSQTVEEASILTGWERDDPSNRPVTMNDPRFQLLFDDIATENQGSSLKDFPHEIRQMMDQGSSLLDAVLEYLAREISKLIILPREKLDVGKSLGDFGIDSMLATELRVLIFRSFDVDVPFTTLLSEKTSVRAIASIIAGETDS